MATLLHPAAAVAFNTTTQPTEQAPLCATKLIIPNKSRRCNRRITTGICCKKSEAKTGAWEEKKLVFVDYDEGKSSVSVQISGLRKAEIPKRYRLRVEGDRSQKDWSISQVVQNVLRLNHWEDVDGVLNRWVGRFARKNFPVLIRVIFADFFFYFHSLTSPLLR